MKKKITFKPWMIFLVTSLGVAMSTIDGGIVNVALPLMSRNFHVTISAVQWIVSSYLLAICVLLPLSGYLGDLFTKRYIYLLGFWIFTIGSFLCGISFSLHSLIFFRFLQGIGAAMLIANNQAIIMLNFPKEKHGKALGINAMTVAIGSIAGPAIGGILIGLFGWRSIFFVNIPLGFLGCYLGYQILPKDLSISEYKFDFLGAITFAIMMTFFVLVLSHGASWGWLSYTTLTCVLIGIAAFWLFVRCEHQATHPMVDLTLFNDWTFSSGNVVALFVFMAISSNLLLLPFYLDQQLHLDPQMIGMTLFIAPIFILLVAPLSGYFTDRYNPALMTTVGTTILFVGLVAQAFLNAHSPLYRVLIDQALVGVGCGFYSTPNNYSILRNVARNKMGTAAGVTSLMRNVGKILGITMATSTFVTLQRYVEARPAHADNAMLAFSVGFKGTLLVAAFFIFISILLSISRRKILAS